MARLEDVFDAVRLFDRAQVERAGRYQRPLYLAAAAGIAVNLGLLALLSFTVVGNRVYGVTSGWPWWARALAYSALVVALTAAAALPIRFWAGYLHEHAWQLSTQSIGSWALDRLKGLAVSLAFCACAPGRTFGPPLPPRSPPPLS